MRQAKAELTIRWLDEGLFGNWLFAIWTTCRFTQEEIRHLRLPKQIMKHPIEWNLRIIRVAMLTCFNLLFCLTDQIHIDCDQFVARLRQQFISVEVAL
jgi:hypothetical protein